MKRKNTTFSKVRKGQLFKFSGTEYKKKSSRTAFVKDMPSRWFYFSADDRVSVRVGTKKGQVRKTARRAYIKNAGHQPDNFVGSFLSCLVRGHKNGKFVVPKTLLRDLRKDLDQSYLVPRYGLSLLKLLRQKNVQQYCGYGQQEIRILMLEITDSVASDTIAKSGGKVIVSQYGNILREFDVKNISEAEIKINKMLNLYNKKRKTTSTYAIYYQDKKGNTLSWHTFVFPEKYPRKNPRKRRNSSDYILKLSPAQVEVLFAYHGGQTSMFYSVASQASMRNSGGQAKIRRQDLEYFQNELNRAIVMAGGLDGSSGDLRSLTAIDKKVDKLLEKKQPRYRQAWFDQKKGY